MIKTDVKFGLCNWEDVELQQKKQDKEKSKDEFIRLDNGDNEVRIITPAFMYSFHQYKHESEKDTRGAFGTRILCSAYHGSCPLCDAGEDLKYRWFIGVIDRKTNSPKILDMGSSIFGQLQKLSRNERIGEPSEYDINIVVDKQAGPGGYYHVQTYGKEPLSDTDVEIKKNFDLEILKRRCTPLTPEEVAERVKRINAYKLKKANGTPLKTEEKANDTQESNASSDDEFNFPPPNLN